MRGEGACVWRRECEALKGRGEEKARRLDGGAIRGRVEERRKACLCECVRACVCVCVRVCVRCEERACVYCEDSARRGDGGARRGEGRAFVSACVRVCVTTMQGEGACVHYARRGRLCMAKRVRGVERAGRGEGEAIRWRGDKMAGRGEKKTCLCECVRVCV